MSLKFPLNICQISEWLISCNLKFLLDPGLKLRMKSTWKLPIDLFNSNVLFSQFRSSHAYVVVWCRIFSLVSDSLTHPQTKENKISTKDNIEPQHIHAHVDKRKFERNSSLTEYRRSISTKFVETPVFSLAKSLYGFFPGILGQSISVTYPTRKTFSDHVTRNASATLNNEA